MLRSFFCSGFSSQGVLFTAVCLLLMPIGSDAVVPVGKFKETGDSLQVNRQKQKQKQKQSQKWSEGQDQSHGLKRSLIVKARIYGRDDRRQITRSNNASRKVGQLVTNYGGWVNYSCTAQLIAPNLLLTAAHCVTHTTSGEFPEQLKYLPEAMNGRESNYPAQFATDIFITRRLRRNLPIGSSVMGFFHSMSEGDVSEDIALVRLGKRPGSEHIGYYTGWFNLPRRVSRAASIIGFTIGYPSDRRDATMWFAPCEAVPYSRRILGTDCDTISGQSGSGFYSVDDNSGGYTIHGVLSGGSSRHAAFTRLTNEMIADILKIIEYGASAPTSAFERVRLQR